MKEHAQEQKKAAARRGSQAEGIATLGFSDQAALDDGAMRPTAYAVKGLTEADEQGISALVEQALG